jgi:hypothetical protein
MATGISTAVQAASFVYGRRKEKVQIADLKSAQKRIPFFDEIRPNQTPNCPEPLTKVIAGTNIYKWYIGLLSRRSTVSDKKTLKLLGKTEF